METTVPTVPVVKRINRYTKAQHEEAIKEDPYRERYNHLVRMKEVGGKFVKRAPWKLSRFMRRHPFALA